MIVMVTGLPGSGKSYFAEHLAEKLDATYINSDRVRFALRSSGKYTHQDKLRVYKEMLTEAAHILEENKIVLVDATFYHHTMREMFVRLAQGYHVPVKLIEVIADEDVIRERLKKPRRYSEADYVVYETVRDDYEMITMPHLILESTNYNLESMLQTAINYIKHGGEGYS